MRFVLRMAGREMRASWSRLVFFFLCIAVGVASMVALRSVIQSVRTALMKESKSLTAADVLIYSNRAFTENAAFVIEEKLKDHDVSETSRAIEATTMARRDGEESEVSTLVELRAIEEGFPYYGKIELAGASYDHALLKNGGALVRPELLTRLDVEVGDSIWIGEQRFEIRGVVVREAGRSLRMFSMGPRVFVDYADIDDAALLDLGGRVWRQILVRMDEEGIQELVWDMKGSLANEFVRVRSYREAGDRLARRLNRGENYLSLAGFVILILGGVGVWSVVRVFIAQKLKSIAVLKCLGASTRQVLAIYFFQVIAMSAVGSLIGVVFAAGAVAAIPPGLGLDLQDVELSLTGSAIVQGVGIGLLVSTLFSLIPLLHVRLVRPLWLLRPEGQLEPQVSTGGLRGWLRKLDRLQVGAGFFLLVALVGLASWQADSLRVGAYVCGTFAVVSLCLHFAGIGLIKAVSPLAKNAYFPLRHAVLNVSRPGNQTRVILLAVGVGVCFVLTIRSIQENLLEEFAVELRDDAPDMFFIDIQRDQVEILEERAWDSGASSVKLVPVLRARVVRLDGAKAQLESYEQVREQGGLGREYTVTYRNHLDDNERIVAGRFWDESHSPDLEVSIESSLRDRYEMDVGDKLTFDIMGRSMEAKITSVRDVEWSDARNGGFMFVFRPGGLENVPNTYAGFIKAPNDALERAEFQRRVLAGIHNVSVVDLRDILDALVQVVEKISLAISVVGNVALLSGVLILLGSVAMTKYQRRYETAIFRTLGASRGRVAMMMFFEYATLGVVAGFIGAMGAQVLTFLLSTQVLEIPFRFAFLTNTVAVLIAAASVSVVGVIVTLDVLRHKPLSILRVG
ncbi:MAG: FtsX-like permease family protein [Acidobacteria bacterium]|nr:MAG: FtsX-like permease family protein [Acidobacteriota bacterium]